MEKSISELIRVGEEKNNLKVNPLQDKAVTLNVLKPCPFCGGEAKAQNSFIGICTIYCKKCGAIVSFNGNEAKPKAIEAWNRRRDSFE